MSTTQAPDRFTALPDDQTIEQTVAGLRERGFGVDVVDDLDAARAAVLARIPHGSPVMTNQSVTLSEAGITDAIDDSGRYESVRTKLMALDRVTGLPEIKAMAMQPGTALGSVHAVTRDGTLLVASALGSQLAAYAWGAEQVVFVVGAQKLVPDLDTARARIFEHCLALENARAREVYGTDSRVGKILEIHQDDPGRIHVVLVRAAVGF